jgi:hypothetical protein
MSGPSPQYSRDELLERLTALADELGRSPTMRECGNASTMPSAATYQHRFGSWSEALTAAGLAPRTVVAQIPQEELLDSLRTLANEIGRPPTISECNAASETASARTYQNRFGSWIDALHAAGIDPRDAPRSVPCEELLADLRHLAEILGRSPSRSDCDAHSSVLSSSTYCQRFGSWNETLRVAGLDPETIETDSRYKLLIDVHDLVETLGAVPTAAEMNEFAPFALHTYELEFGSWDAAIEAVGTSESTPTTETEEPGREMSD